MQSEKRQFDADARRRLIEKTIAGDWRSRRVFRRTSRRLAEAMVERWPAGSPVAVNGDLMAEVAIEVAKPRSSITLPPFLWNMLARIVFRQLWKMFEKWRAGTMSIQFDDAVGTRPSVAFESEGYGPGE